MPAKLYRVALTQSEREQLLDIARKGKTSARKVKRSLILCKADEGLTDQQVSQALLVGPSTVSRVRRRFVEEGLESALKERPGLVSGASWMGTKKPTWWRCLHSCARRPRPLDHADASGPGGGTGIRRLHLSGDGPAGA